MPINLPNWAQHETADYGSMSGILENALKGYEMSRKPHQIKQEERQRDLANRLQQELGTKAEIENRYLPRKSEADIGNTEQQTKMWGAQTRGYDIDNMIEEALGMKTKQANLENIHSQTRSHNATANRTEQLTPHDIAKAIIDNSTARTNLEALPRDISQRHAKGEQEIQKTNRSLENPEFEYGTDIAKLLAIADIHEEKGEAEKADAIRELAKKLQDENLAKATKSAGKAPKTQEEIQADAFAKAKGTEQAKQYTKAQENLEKTAKFRNTAQMLKSMTKDPNFSNAIGPWDAKASWIMFPDTKEFRQEFKSTLGRAQFDMLEALKGSSSDKEMAKVEDITADVGDREATVIGYVNAINNLSDLAYKRQDLIAEQLGKGIPYNTALANAQKAYPIPDRKALEKSQGAKSGIDEKGKHHDNIDPTNVEIFKKRGGTIIE